MVLSLLPSQAGDLWGNQGAITSMDLGSILYLSMHVSVVAVDLVARETIDNSPDPPLLPLLLLLLLLLCR